MILLDAEDIILDFKYEEDRESKKYLNILNENSSSLTNLIIGDSGGKIAIRDVLGDEMLEMLYIYSDGISEYLKIFTYSVTEGVEAVFETRVFIAAGSGDNYCIYLTGERELAIYHSTFSSQYSCGFWPIIPNQELAIVEDFGAYNYSSDLSQLGYWTMHIKGIKYWRFLDSPAVYQEEQYEDGEVYNPFP